MARVIGTTQAGVEREVSCLSAALLPALQLNARFEAFSVAVRRRTARRGAVPMSNGHGTAQPGP